MNPFFDISPDDNLPYEALELNNLGGQRIMVMIGTSRRNDWGDSSMEHSTFYEDTVPGDYDNQFANKLDKWRPIYEMNRVIDHHYKFYLRNNQQGADAFLKHMRYVILPIMKRRKNKEECIELFEEWIDTKTPKKQSNTTQTVKNTINIGQVNAPLQFQQNSDNSTQTQHNHNQAQQIRELFDLLTKDIANVDEQIRADFAMEMNYAVAQLERNKDVKSQLLSIGGLIKDVGMGTFTNLLAAPLFEIIKPLLGL